MDQPKYIANLLKAAEVRKKENEIVFERVLQKEREQEDAEFGMNCASLNSQGLCIYFVYFVFRDVCS